MRTLPRVIPEHTQKILYPELFLLLLISFLLKFKLMFALSLSC